MESLIMAIDQGTTGSTVLLIDRYLRVRARSTHEFAQIYPKPGWVSHDPEAIWRSVQHSANAALDQVPGAIISAIGITNQRETTVVWDRISGVPVSDAIVWQCRRTEPLCRELKEAGLEPLFRQKTGLVLDPYFSGTKIRWILDNVDGARAKAEAGQLYFGTIDTYLVWRLTGGRCHVTDVSNASRTLLMDLESLQWDSELLDHLQIPRSMLPTICGSAEVYGTTVQAGVIPAGVPVAGIAGDQQAALFGQLCLSPGTAKCTYGTGSFLLMNTGARPILSRHGLLTTVAWKIGSDVTYALEGSAFIAGAAVQWLRDGLRIIKKASDIEILAREVEDSGGLIFVPALAGLGAPHWRPEARGLLHGIDRSTTVQHIARAVLEGIALQNHDLLTAMQNDLQEPFTQLKVDGGAAVNDLLMQFQADILGVNIIRPKMLETTALGAAMLAGLATETWNNFQDLQAAWSVDRTFKPSMPPDRVATHLARWQSGLKKA